MKKILITILALIAALVMCFAFVACDGDNGNDNPPAGPGTSQGDPDDNKPSGGDDDKKPSEGDDDDEKPSDDDDKKPDVEPGKAVSIKLNDALEVIDGVLTAEGFTATATYSLSSKNTETETDSISIDKRGSKIKVGDVIVDYATGYVYKKAGDGKYVFDQEFTAGDVDYIKYMITSFVGEDEDAAISARYDEQTKIIKFTIDKAESVNKYLDPLYTAYGKSKKLGVMLDEYSELLCGKKFDKVYDIIEAYVKNPKNTFGGLLDLLKDKAGIDVEALLKEFDVELPAEIMTAVKARKLGEAVVGAYNYIKQVIGDMIGGVMAEDASDGDEDIEAGMTTVATGLLDALLFNNVTPAQIEAGLAEIKSMMPVLKEMSVRGLIDMALEKDEDLAELYTAIKNSVKFKNISMTVTLTVDENKTLTGVKADFLVAHTYNGAAPESYTLLADNDYLTSVELKIDEYKTEVADFDIKFSPNANYKVSVAQVVYEFTDKDISVYYETAGNKVNVSAIRFEKYTQDDVTTVINNVPEDALKFDAATSSFVFDVAFVKSVLENSPAGTYLYAYVCFDGNTDDYRLVTLVYLNDNVEEVSDYLSDYLSWWIQNHTGSNMPEIPSVTEKPDVNAPQA